VSLAVSAVAGAGSTTRVKVAYYRQDIEATLLHGVNNARSESANTKIRLIARRASDFTPLRH
jgi:transposase